MDTPTPPQAFSWGRFIVENHLRGLAAMLACHCEPKFYNAEIPLLQLELPAPMAAFKDSPAMQELHGALKHFIGDSLELEVVCGKAAYSPTAQSCAKRVDGLVKAHEAVMGDALVREYVKRYGARVLVDTVKPVAAAPRKP